MARPDVDFTIDFTPDHVEQFKCDGFLWIEAITTRDEIEWFRTIYDELMATPSNEYQTKTDDRVVKENGMTPQTHPEVYQSAFIRNGRRIAEAILGEPGESLPVIGQMLYKPPGAGREIGWHQDEAFWPDNIVYRGVAVWMPLDDVTIESGCMQFIPGSHRNLVEHVRDPDDPADHLRYVPELPGAPVACPIPAGGATLHDFRTMHYTARNTSSRPRRAIVNRFYGGPDKGIFAAAGGSIRTDV